MNYQVVIAGVTVGVYGTSCSTPVFAAFVTLLNGQRKVKGLNSVGRARHSLLIASTLLDWLSPIPSFLPSYLPGFMNPTLYNASYAKKYNDITSGSNKCCAYTGRLGYLNLTLWAVYVLDDLIFSSFFSQQSCQRAVLHYWIHCYRRYSPNLT